MTTRYILNDDWQPVPEPDLDKWREWIVKPKNRIIRLDIVGQIVMVATTFLGRPWDRDETPKLFQTRIFDHINNDYHEEYHTAEEARQGHSRAIQVALTISEKP